MRRRVAFRIVLALAGSTTLAHAAEPTAPEGDERLAVGLTLGETASPKVDGNLATYHRSGALQVAARYRLRPMLFLGGVASLSGFGELFFYRLAAELRAHAIRSRWLGIWGGAELGLGVLENVESESDSRLRAGALFFAPLVGIGAGADFYFVPALSVGLEARAVATAHFTHIPGGDIGDGLTHFFLVGLTMTLHFSGAGDWSPPHAQLAM